MTVKHLIWDEWNVAHVGRHRVIPDEVEQVCLGNRYIVRESYKDRLMLIGLTSAGRILAIVVAPKGEDTYFVVTARTADRKERRAYQLEKGGGIT